MCLSNTRRIISFLILLIVIPASLSKSTNKNYVKEYDWGVVQTEDLGNSLLLHITLGRHTAFQKRPPSTNLQSDPDLYDVLYSFFLALPPHVAISLKVQSRKQTPRGAVKLQKVKSYQADSDSSIIHTVYEEDVTPAVVPCLLEGYSWYRGYKLARITVNPFIAQSNMIYELSSMDVLVQYEMIPQAGLKTSQPQRGSIDETVSKIVVNDGDIAALPTTALTWIDSTKDWIPANNKAIKLSIASDGIYRLTYDSLKAISQDIDNLDPASLKLVNRGKEMPLFLHQSHASIFGPGDYVEFAGLMNYGRQDYRAIPKNTLDEYPQYLDKYTDTSCYWLTWGGVAGLRMDSLSVYGSPIDTLVSYTEQVHIEEDHDIRYCDGNNIFLRQDPLWTSGDMWGWDGFTAGDRFDVNFRASNIASLGDSITLFVRASSATWPGIIPNYRLRLLLNGSDTLLRYDDAGLSQHILMKCAVPLVLLRDGGNTLSVAFVPAASPVNYVIYDWADVEYPRTLNAVQDTLRFRFSSVTTPAIRVVKLSGFSSSNILIYKYNPTLKRISNIQQVSIVPNIVCFTDTVYPGDAYYAFLESKVKDPCKKELVSIEGLRTNSIGADYLLITHPKLMENAGNYATMIANRYQYRTAVVNVASIFNEYGYGYPTAESIKEFIKSTVQWPSPMPKFVCIVGDASYDYKNKTYSPNPATQAFNAVPSFGNPVSDVWFTVIDDSSNLPQMAVGRIPARNNEEFQRYFQHVQSYFSTPNDDWNKRYILFSGGFTTSDNVSEFKYLNDEIKTSLIEPPPIGGLVSNFYRTSNPQSEYGPYTSESIKESIENGGVFINYIGHSGTQTWDNGIGDPIQLQNTKGRYALISDFGCSTGKFAEPNIRCFGELFTVGEQSSAIAYIGNTSLGFYSIASSLPKLFSKQFFAQGVYAIGEAHRLSKIERYNLEGKSVSYETRIMMLTNTLLGDPAIELDIPKQPNLTFSGSLPYTVPPQLSDDDNSALLEIPYRNTGKVTPDSIRMKLTYEYQGIHHDTLFYRPLPLFQDTMSIHLSVKDQPGDHSYTIDMNEGNGISELRTDDNKMIYKAFVGSTALRILRPLNGYRQKVSTMTFLNPTKDPGLDAIIQLEVGTDSTFSHSLSLLQPLGVLRTTIVVPQLILDQKYYWRAGFLNSTKTKTTGTFIHTASDSIIWRLVDSLDWNTCSLVDCVYQNDHITFIKGIMPGNKQITIRATSAGFYAGRFGAVEVNGINMLPNSFTGGHNIAVFDSSTLALQDTRVYGVYASSAVADSLRIFVENLPYGKIFVDVVNDEGSTNLSQQTRDAFKTLGSQYIDKLGWRESWAIIGWKGATPGTVPELWVDAYADKAIIETTFVRQALNARVIGPEIGPAGHWLSANIESVIPPGAAIRTSILGVQENNQVDTVIMGYSGGTLSLTAIDPTVYKGIKLVADLFASPTGNIPQLQEWNVAISSPAEIAVNYQSVSVSSDSVLEGNPVTATANIYNLNSDTALSVRAIFSGIQANIIRDADTSFCIIKADSFATVTYLYPTAERRGPNTLNLEIALLQKYQELYKSNNSFAIPIYVEKDSIQPIYDITFDGIHIYNDDYILCHPTIQIRIFDNSPLPITNPSNVTLKLDNRSITLGTTPDSTFEVKSGLEKAMVTYKPKLEKGSHVLSLQIKDATGNYADTVAKEISFRVETEAKLLNVINYPNPFRSETYFTFNITGAKLPEEAKIKIYTITGRLIQEIRLPQSVLLPGFNRILWDGKDRDGSELANGIYLYKVTMSSEGTSAEVIQKLVKVR